MRHTTHMIIRERLAPPIFIAPLLFALKMLQRCLRPIHRLHAIEASETDAERNTRAFSIASAPYEKDIMIVTRMRDTAFKRILGTMPIGSKVNIQGPSGGLTLQDTPDLPTVLLAGGIGITPFSSIILQTISERVPHHISLFYSNRRPEDAAFLEELSDLEKVNRNFKFIPTMTQPEQSTTSWKGETGPITHVMLEKHLDHVAAPIYYIAGPPNMVGAMQKILNDAGISRGYVR